ncbi:hypothetical protein FKP32DRAFT_27994, partial [Trametes sanguinea]
MADRRRSQRRRVLLSRRKERSQPTMDKPKREAILDLAKYVNERIRVKFTGGREVTGVLKGYDQLL